MAKTAAKGTAFKWTISASLTAIASVTDITAPEATANLVKVNSLDGSAGDEYIFGGYIDYGEPKISGYLDPAAATFKALTTDMVAGTSRAASVAWSDAGTSSWTFTAFVKSVGANATEEQALKFNAGFRITGAITYPT